MNIGTVSVGDSLGADVKDMISDAGFVYLGGHKRLGDYTYFDVAISDLAFAKLMEGEKDLPTGITIDVEAIKCPISAYLASPWFNAVQMDVMRSVRKIIIGEFTEEIDLFAPYFDGIVLDKDNDSLEMRERVFDLDIGMVARVDLVVAIVDDFDPGTIFEMGGGSLLNWVAKKSFNVKAALFREGFRVPDIIAFSNVTGRGLNLMLAQGIWGFANGYTKLRDQLQRYVHGEPRADYLEFIKGDLI